MEKKHREVRALGVRTRAMEREAAWARALEVLRLFREGRATRAELADAEALAAAADALEPEVREERSAQVVPLHRAEPETISIQGLIPYGEVANIGSFDEVLLPGAFASATDGDTILSIAHELGGAHLLARTTNGTLKLEDRADGLHFTATIPATAIGEHVARLVRDGTYGVSFGFANPRARWSDRGHRRLREIQDIGTLYDISLVSFPAYPGARAWVRGSIRDASGRRVVGVRVTRDPDGRIVRRDLYEGDPMLGSDDDALARLKVYRRRLELAMRA